MCFEGFRISRERQDSDVWNWFGAYGISALCFAIDHCFNGKKAKMEYWKEPLFSNKTENDSEMSEEEIQRQREAFVMKMRTMKVNFDLSHQETTFCTSVRLDARFTASFNFPAALITIQYDAYNFPIAAANVNSNV
jgi:hypothetical protein